MSRYRNATLASRSICWRTEALACRAAWSAVTLTLLSCRPERSLRWPIALSNARSSHSAAEPLPEPSWSTRRHRPCQRTVAASQLKLRVACLVRGCLPCRAHPAARNARKRSNADTDCIGSDLPRCCRGSVSCTDPPCAGPSGGAGIAECRLGDGTVAAWDAQRFLAPYAMQFVDELVAHCRRGYPGRECARRVPPLPPPKEAIS